MFIKQNIKNIINPLNITSYFFHYLSEVFIDFCLKKNIKNFYKICLLLKIF